MCGIAGIVGPRAHLQAQVVDRMNAVQRHRGPDDDGVFSSPGVALGAVRLAIVDPTSAGHQPMSTPDGRYTIVHNGEVYNYRELRARLADFTRFVSDTDTEVVLQAFARWGAAAVEQFVGMFAFAIWDRDSRRLFCARDRFGIKPFYYAPLDDSIVFASEIKTLLEAGVAREPDMAALRDYLAFGFYEHGAGTFFSPVRRLMPGCTLTLAPGDAPVEHRYYALAEHVEENAETDTRTAAPVLRERLEEAVRSRLRADVKVGVSLSGGLDSSTLLAVLDRFSEGRGAIEAFSAVYADSRYSERPWIESMARATGRRVTFSQMEPDDVWNAMEAVTWFQDEPFGGVPTVSWVGLYGATLQRDVKVLLDGNGLDDILGGYRSHCATYLSSLFLDGPFDDFRREFDGYTAAWGVPWGEALRDLWQACRGETGVRAIDGSSPVRPDCVTLPAEGPPRFERPFVSRVKNQMYQGLCFTKVPRSLRFLDRASMMFSRELRVPFLDHRLVEYCFSLPDALYVRNGLTKYVLREAVSGLVPDDVRLAPKRSVPAPQREWLSGPLKSRVADIIGSRSFASRGLFDVPGVRRAYEQFCAGDAANSFFVWQWVNLELWFRTFIDSPAPARPVHVWPDFTVPA